MKISHTLAPNYRECVEKFGIDFNKGAIITFGDTVYCKDVLTPDLEAHEQVHIDQQKDDHLAWWERYYIDPKFRFDQELPAFRAQYRMVRRWVSDRELAHKCLMQMAENLSTIYGLDVSVQEAAKLIKQ